MRDRAIAGTTAWTRYEIVLDIPQEAMTMNFGVAFLGEGAGWIDDVTLEVVERNVPTTAVAVPKKPMNLGFEE